MAAKLRISLLFLHIQDILSHTDKTSLLICYIDTEKINLIKALANSVSYQFLQTNHKK